jgi:hypothetical protein
MLVMKVPMKNQPKIRPVVRVSNVVLRSLCGRSDLPREPWREGPYERQVHAPRAAAGLVGISRLGDPRERERHMSSGATTRASISASDRYSPR